jgi:ABC-type polysaccharide/polyol phosphate export permease
LARLGFFCRYVIRRFNVASTVAARVAMGGSAFALLLLAELVLGALLSGRTTAEHFALYRDTSYALGLVAQLGFGLMPLVRMGQGKEMRSAS